MITMQTSDARHSVYGSQGRIILAPYQGGSRRLNVVIAHKIRKYGYGIMASPLFQQGFNQAHHYRTTVSDHSLNVAYYGLMICALLIHLGIKVNERDLVRAALCHDLGILGRYDKFRNNQECCVQHPIDSLAIAENMLPDITEIERDSIRYHMFPIMCPHPHHAEGWIITVADKIALARDMAWPVPRS